MKEKQEHKSYAHAGRAVESYLDGVGQEALKRAGGGDQLKGIAQEIMFRDKLNAKALLQGQAPKAQLSPSLNDRVSDIHEGTARYQVKDVTSASGLRDLSRRVAGGQYEGAKLVGSPETAQAASAHGVKVESTGISSSTTKRVADNAGVKVRDNDLLTSNLRGVGQAGVVAGGLGGLTHGVLAAYNHRDKLKRKEIGQYAKAVSSQAAKGAVTSGAKTVAALGLKEGAKLAAQQVGSQALKRAAGSNPATAVAFGVVELSYNAARYAKGDLNAQELVVASAQTVGSTSGAITGAAAGAAIGSVVPLVGTAIGAGVGGFVGGFVGGTIGRAVVKPRRASVAAPSAASASSAR